jgi:hypothetical protein
MEQYRSFAIERDLQQCSVASVVFRGNQQASFHPADQSMPFNAFHPFTSSLRVWPVDVERNRIVPLGLSKRMARRDPSGDKLQLQSGSICGGSAVLPLLTSNRNVSRVAPFAMLYRRSVDGKRAHRTFQILTSLRIKRGVPPAIGTAKMEEAASEPTDLGVEMLQQDGTDLKRLALQRHLYPILVQFPSL